MAVEDDLGPQITLPEVRTIKPSPPEKPADETGYTYALPGMEDDVQQVDGEEGVRQTVTS